MNRVVGMLAAFVVLLLLVSGFMAADNIRLNGEHAALADQYSEKSYQHAVATKQLESVKEQLEAMTQERDELVRQLQDYQPGNSGQEATEAAEEQEVIWHQPVEPLPEDAGAEKENFGEETEEEPAEEAAQVAKTENALEIQIRALEQRIQRLEEMLLQAETAAEEVEKALLEEPDPQQLLQYFMPNAEEIMKRITEAFQQLAPQITLPLAPQETPVP